GRLRGGVRVVAQHVVSPEGVGGGPCDVLGGLWLGDVTGQMGDFPVAVRNVRGELLDSVDRGGCVDIDDQQVGPVLAERGGDATADAARTAGHDRRLPTELHCCPAFPRLALWATLLPTFGTDVVGYVMSSR